MALVPISNGVDGVVGGVGVLIVDEGASIFTVNLNVKQTGNGTLNNLFVNPYPIGVTDLFVLPNFRAAYSGLHLLSVLFEVSPGAASRPIVAGPDDRANFIMLDPVGVAGVLSGINFKIYNTPIGGDPQLNSISTTVTLVEGTLYNFFLRIFNVSGTLSARRGYVDYTIYPLTSAKAPAPDPGPPGLPAMPLMSAAPPVVNRNQFIRRNGYTHRRLDIPK
jgi:hypothetical protein